jgi:translation initiation factor 2 beta subunit (eIF-2beta)/eIF-5
MTSKENNQWFIVRDEHYKWVEDIKTNNMKNIHVLPTDKPSRLYSDKGKLWLDDLVYADNNQHIYITSDEEIKEGWYINTLTNYIAKGSGVDINWKHIILTTDQELIKDGVQAIDDEFLEWFVKNSSCESVEIIKTAPIRPFGSLYKIIIPKPTQQLIDEDFNGGLTMGQIIPQEEKMYTEEDVKNAFLDGWQLRDGDLPFPKAKKKWFEQFKKK